MKKKLILSINDDLIDFAHDFSKETNQSISHIVEKYLAELKNQQEKGIKEQKLNKDIYRLQVLHL
jgi:acetyl-CoA carboxylase alpha subunit